ncbi:hypothetical protein [Lutibacter citreus]|uniref:hypothetical protein n=1 Tax=Lutibacter citreus TaxID=2138210 RepID=UPI000DBE07C7|nr:hypothetical protein [Lutibacter citreus]
MNKFKLLTIALFLGSASLFASTIINPVVSKDEIRKQIVELVASSTGSVENEIVVDVTFTFSTEGEIVVKKLSTRDKHVLKFVRENLNGKKIANPGRANRNYTMPIIIK